MDDILIFDCIHTCFDTICYIFHCIRVLFFIYMYMYIGNRVEKFPRISPIFLEQLVPHVMSKLRLPPNGGTVDISLGPGPRIVRYASLLVYCIYSSSFIPLYLTFSFALCCLSLHTHPSLPLI